MAAARLRFSPLKAALKYCRQRIRKFIAINNEEWEESRQADDEGTLPGVQHIAIRWRRHGKHDEDDDIDDASCHSLADKLLIRARARARV